MSLESLLAPLRERFASMRFTAWFAVLILGVCCASAAGQAGDWTWVGGSDTVPGHLEGQPGVYGTLGVPAVGNVPGGRINASGSTDSRGHFWLFGGFGADAIGDENSGYLNDLWEFSLSTNEWTWMGGSSTFPGLDEGQPGAYGTLGIPGAGNTPGGRYAASSWIDSSGNFWLFGGEGYDESGNFGSLNDLWEFNLSASQWMWMGGSSTVNCQSCGQPGVYGTLGTPATGNIPGGRYAFATWTDSSGHLWLFGGEGFDVKGNQGDLNDLWEFDPSTNNWTWMGGSSIGIQPGTYGTQGTPATGNVPGARDSAASVTDKSGHFWLFGGEGDDANGDYGNLSDLWEFNPSTKEWVWVNGSTVVGQSGVYGTVGIPSASETPGSRWAASSWADISGNLWIFEGAYQGTDLWEFSPSTSEWTWIRGITGDGQASVYGTLGIPAPSSSPGSRASATTWTDSSGNLWLFGGYSYDVNDSFGYLNDLWEYQPSPIANPPSQVPAISSIYPVSATVDSGNFYLTIAGSNFVPDATVYFGSTALNATFRSATKLTALVPAGLIAATATASITVKTSVGTSNGATFTILPGLPTITNLSPDSATAFGAGLTLTIYGTNFVTGVTAYWWSVPLATTVVSSDQITVQIPSSYLSNPTVSAPVTVKTVAGTSNTATFSILYPPPVVTLLVPSWVYVGSPTFTLDVYGRFFYPGSTVYWCWECFGTQTELATTYDDDREVYAVVPHSLLLVAGWAGITVVTPYGTSYSFRHDIYAPPPTISELSPSSTTAGAGTFNLTITGTNFVPGATAKWGSTALATTVNSLTQLTATVPGSLTLNPGNVRVTVSTEGGASPFSLFTINPALPAINSLSPNSTTAGGGTFTLTINGMNLASGAKVYWGTTRLTSTFVNTTQLTASVPATLITSAGSVSITVTTGGGTSAPATFTIN